MKILVIQKKRIGDVLTTTVIFDALREAFPQAELHYLVYPFCVPVVAHHPNIDQLVVFDPQAKPALWHFLRMLWRLRRARYDVIIDAYGKPNSLLMAWCSGARRIISFDKPKYRWLTTDPVIRQTENFSVGTSAIDHRMQLLGPLGVPFALWRPQINITPKERSEAQQHLKAAGISTHRSLWMISAIGSRDFKTYPLAYMAQLLEKLLEVDPTAQLLFNYEPHQRQQAQALYDLCTPQVQSAISMSLYIADLRGFLALLSHCNALLGNEGGATNMAKALGLPTFSIFSPAVDKKGWNMYEDGHTHCSVQVRDYKTDSDLKEADNATQYALFTPDLFTADWQAFVRRHARQQPA